MPRLPIPRAKRMQARRKQAIALRKRGFSYAEIGQLLTPKVSRQAVSKLIETEEKK